VSKGFIVVACPLHFGAGGRDCGPVCYMEPIGTRLEAGQGFWGDALIVVENIKAIGTNSLCSSLNRLFVLTTKFRKLWEYLFFFSLSWAY